MRDLVFLMAVTITVAVFWRCDAVWAGILTRGTQIFEKSRRYLKIRGARLVTLSKVHTENVPIFGVTV